MTVPILIVELGVVAGDDASLPWPGVFRKGCRDEVARVNVQVVPQMGILTTQTHVRLDGLGTAFSPVNSLGSHYPPVAKDSEGRPQR
jgi:hypothetical protein